jgi:tetratricopeptide (TPR) repeat protein
MEGTAGLLDNTARLFWLQLAASSIALHPWLGGGSRSFSWENLQFWDGDWSKFSDAEPEFVHNEWLQIASDYGIVGLLLLVTFLGAVLVTAVLGRWNGAESKAGTPVMLAGVAALAGLLVHACFHFVFHIPPLALLLGLVLAMVLETRRQGSGGATGKTAAVAVLLPAGCALVLGGAGVMAFQAFRELAPLRYRFGQGLPPAVEAVDRIERASHVWPGHSLPLQRGHLLKELAVAAPGAQRGMLLESAAVSMREASRLHPFDPDASVNLANVLSTLERDEEAEREFERAIRLQGGAERSFQASFWASRHFWSKSERLRAAGKADEALGYLFKARDLFDREASDTLWEYGSEARAYRMALSQHLGTWLEGLRRHEEAAAEYDRAVQRPWGQGMHFLAARNLTAWGESLWQKRRPEEALAKFIAARERTNQAAGMPPPGHTVTEIVELAHLLDAKIAFLKGAGIVPEE